MGAAVAGALVEADAGHGAVARLEGHAQLDRAGARRPRGRRHRRGVPRVAGGAPAITRVVKDQVVGSPWRCPPCRPPERRRCRPSSRRARSSGAKVSVAGRVVGRRPATAPAGPATDTRGWRVRWGRRRSPRTGAASATAIGRRPASSPPPGRRCPGGTREDDVDPVVGAAVAGGGEAATDGVPVDPVAAAGGRRQRRQRPPGGGRDEVVQVVRVTALRGVVGHHVRGIGRHRHGIGEGRLLPPGGRLSAECHRRQAGTCRRPQRPHVRATITRPLVEPDPGHHTGLAGPELHTQLGGPHIGRGSRPRSRGGCEQ